MYSHLVLLLLFSTFPKELFGYHCEKHDVEDKTKSLYQTRHIQNEYEDIEDYDGYRTTFEPPTPPPPLYRTILCSNITSLQNFFYDYIEESFEQHLKIHNSQISTVFQSSFVQFPTITKLFLNHLNIETILPGAFNGLTRLKELHLGYNHLQEVSKGVFNSLHRLQILTLRDNNIYHIENMAFVGNDNLISLHLENNNLTTLDNNLLETQKHLKSLDLAGNPLIEFSLNGMSSLLTLNLSQTAMTRLEKDLGHLTMTTLNLSSSQLSVVDFKRFPKLYELDLSYNRIVSLDNCQSLVSVSVRFDNNQIKTITGAFNDISVISISHNELEVLSNTLFGNSKSVTVVDLSFNRISIIEKYAFQGLHSLSVLSLQHNNVSTLDPVLFRDLHQLKRLNLSNNQIEQFQFGTFDSLSELQVLDVSNNRLVKLHENTFHSLSNLHRLCFDNNKISSLNVKDLKWISRSLHYISMDQNPWKCEDLHKIRKELQFYEIVIMEGSSYNVENIHGIACQNVPTFIKDGNDTKIERFLNEDFERTKFFRYFEEEYKKSNFFKFLDNYETVKKNLSASKAERLTYSDNTSDRFSDRILVFNALVQVMIVLILLGGICLIYGFLKKIVYAQKKEQLSQIELC